MIGDDALLNESPQTASVCAKGICLVLSLAVEQLYFIRDKIQELMNGGNSQPSKLRSALSFRVDAKMEVNRTKHMKLFVRVRAHYTCVPARVIAGACQLRVCACSRCMSKLLCESVFPVLVQAHSVCRVLGTSWPL